MESTGTQTVQRFDTDDFGADDVEHSANQSNDIVRHGDVGRLSVSITDDGRCIYDGVDSVAIGYLGLTRGELIGSTPREAFAHDWSRRLDDLHRRVIESRAPVSVELPRSMLGGRQGIKLSATPVIGAGRVRSIQITAYETAA